jgi:DNA-binding response OmpR family regulator
MKRNILIIEDDIKIRFLLRDYLKKEDFQVYEASDGDEGLNLFKNNKIDLILLDIMMPKVDGITVLETIRTVSDVPIILLTAKGQEEDKLFGYEMGADDYVTKPFSPKVLIAKVKAFLKRRSDSINDSSVAKDYNGLVINKLSHEVSVNGTVLNLSPKEFELLIYLSENIGIALTRDTILDNVWGIDYYGDLRTVDTNIKRLREKLGEKSNYIVTVRGSGYKFEVCNEK